MLFHILDLNLSLFVAAFTQIQNAEKFLKEANKRNPGRFKIIRQGY